MVFACKKEARQPSQKRTFHGGKRDIPRGDVDILRGDVDIPRGSENLKSLDITGFSGSPKIPIYYQ